MKYDFTKIEKEFPKAFALLREHFENQYQHREQYREPEACGFIVFPDGDIGYPSGYETSALIFWKGHYDYNIN
jgi:hypothetical protein